MAKAGKVWQPREAVGHRRYLECLAHVRGGGSLVLDEVWRFSPQCATVRCNMEMATGHRVSANYYITPPYSQAFAKHRDRHDVVIFQVKGQKEWEVWIPGDQRHLTLKAGDAMYIRADTYHHAFTDRTGSSHITFGVHSEPASEPMGSIWGANSSHLRVPTGLPLLQESLSARKTHARVLWSFDDVRIEVVRENELEVELRLTRHDAKIDFVLTPSQADELLRFTSSRRASLSIQNRLPNFSLLEWCALLEFAISSGLLKSTNTGSFAPDEALQ
jgi:hypothetical protein